MTIHDTGSTELATPKQITDLINEYNEKYSKIDDMIRQWEESKHALNSNVQVFGTYRTGSPLNGYSSTSSTTMKKYLLENAWWAVWSALKLDIIAPVSDRKNFEQAMSNPPEFTMDNIKASFSKYMDNPMDNILRGIAEIFIELDPAYKSHSKVKIGVEGMPKRIVMSHMCNEGKYPTTYCRNKIGDLVSALQVFDGDGPTDGQIISDITYQKMLTYRGLEFKWFKNGNLHVHFSIHARNQINRALAAFYGDVLPDVEENPDKKKPSTALSKDLQYYPTPNAVCQIVTDKIRYRAFRDFLEPSCGCGRLMDAIKIDSPDANIVGVECYGPRVMEARAKGHHVLQDNFLELPANPSYDCVVMNPPFYGKHYLKHVEHAFGFVKKGECNQIICILPATAHYDHKLLPKGYTWYDLPLASFEESGTRVPTGIAVWNNV